VCDKRILDNCFHGNYYFFVRDRTPQSAVSDLRSHTGFWLRFVSNHVSHSFARKLVGSGVTVAEWVVLREMFDANTTSPSALATATGLTRGAISKLIERLVQKDLASRAEAAGDRRFQEVRLTSAGRVLVPQLAALADQNDHEFFSQLPVGERDRLVATLKKLVAANKLKQIPIT
jgi:DNA-binding MarR family transcriptional regulator